MKNKKWLIAVPIGLTLLLLSGCEAPQTKVPQLSASDSLDIARAIATKYVRRFPPLTHSSTSMARDSFLGEHVSLDDALSQIRTMNSRILNPIQSMYAPIYVEFSLDSLQSNLDRIQDTIGTNDIKKVHMRVYFSSYPSENKFYSALLVTAIPDDWQAPSVYTDNRGLIFDVGSACPPDCNFGKLNSNDIEVATKGALLARDAYKKRIHDDLKCPECRQR